MQNNIQNRNFYNEILTEHNMRPEFKYDLPAANVVLEGVNPNCGDDIFYTHDENDFFPEECYVTAYGELFEDCEGAYSTFGDAIRLWCEKTGVSQDGRNEQKMIDFINEYEYEAEDTNFCINPITFG